MYNAYILQFQDVTHDIRIVTIQMPKDRPFAYHAGQYVDIELPGYDPRTFSIANAPRGDHTIDIHIRNSGQNISHALCSEITQGQGVIVSEAKGRLRMQNKKATVVFLAGGTGITPFLAMMEEVGNQTPITLYWGMGHEDEFYIRPQRQGLRVNYCVEDYPVDRCIKEGFTPDTHFYLSGPPAMVKDSRAKLLAAGVEPSNIFYDE